MRKPEESCIPHPDPAIRRPSVRIIPGAVLGTALSVLLASAALAQDRTWNAADSSWFTGGNWLPPAVPTAGQEVWIDNNGTARIGAAGAVAGSLFVGVNSTGSLVIQGGGSLTTSSFSIIGRFAGSQGTMTITGTGSVWNPVNNFVVGSSGTGDLNVLAGGAVNHSGAPFAVGGNVGGIGRIQVSGAGSSFSSTQLLTIGSTTGGTGTLNVDDGAVASLTGGIQFLGNGGSILLEGTAGSRGALRIATITENTGATGSIDFDGGILRANSSQANMLLNFESGDVTLLSGGAFLDSNGFTSGISSVLDGVGRLTKQGSGTITLSAANTYSGGTTVEAGTLKAGAAGAFGTNGGFIVNGGTLDLGGQSLTMTSLTGTSGNVLVDGAGVGQTLTLNAATSGTYGGAVTGQNTAVFLKTGAGTFTVTGGVAFASSTVQVNGGTFRVEGGTNSSQDLQLGTTGATNGTAELSGGTWTNTTTLQVGSQGTGTLRIGDGAILDHTAGISSANTPVVGRLAGSTGTLVVDGSGSELRSQLNAIIVGSAGTGALTVSNGGKVSILNAGAILAVGTSASGQGTVNIGAPAGEAPEAAGILNVPRINGTTLLKATLVLNHTDTGYFLTNDGTSGGAALALTGNLKLAHENGITTINGNANTYVGSTTISGGTLLASNTGGSATGTGTVTVMNGGTLGGSGFITGQVTVQSGGGIAPGNSIGTLSLNSLSINGGSRLQFELGGGNASDLILIGAGGVSLLGPANFNFLDAGADHGTFSYTLMSGTAVNTLDLTQLSHTSAMLFENAAFQLSGTDLLFAGTFTGFYGGALLDNAVVPTTGNFLVQGAVQTGSSANNTINSLQFDPGSSLQVFNNLTVTSGDFTVDLGTATLVGGNVIVPGDFTKLGAGSLFANSNFQVSGNSYIQQGALHVNGVFVTNALFVLPAGFLGGNGTIIGNVFNSGTVGPGNSVGTLTIHGNYTQTSRGTLQIEIASPRSFDRLIVSGTAHLGGTLAVTSLGARLKYGQQYPFLQAGKITGKFNRIEMPDPSLFRGRFVNAGHLGILLVAPTSYTLVAKTPNETHVATALDQWIGIEDGDIGEVTLALDVLSEDQYAQAFQAIMPGYYEAAANTAIELSHNMGQLLHQQLNARRLGQRAAVATASSSPPIEVRKAIIPVQPPKSEDRWNAWMQGSGMFSQGGLSLIPDEDFESGTFLIGADFALDDHFAVGIFAGYQEGWTDYADGGETDLDSVRFGAYLTYDDGGLYANAIAGGGSTDFDVKRPIRWAALDRTTRSHPDATEFFTLLGGGYDYTAGHFTFGPQVSVQYTRLAMHGFTEAGADSLDLRVDDFDSESLRSSIGFRAACTWKIGDEVAIIPEIRAFWQHEFMQDGQGIHSSLDDGSGPAFDYVMAEPDRDRLFIGAGLGLQLGPRFYANLYYNADFGHGDDVIHTVSMNANWSF